jgi:hypothetical protein
VFIVMISARLGYEKKSRAVADNLTRCDSLPAREGCSMTSLDEDDTLDGCECDPRQESRMAAPPNKPLKKRRLRLEEDVELQTTCLMRQVASCWLDHPSNEIATTPHGHALVSPLPQDWGQVVASLPPTSGSYLYNERYCDNTKKRSLIEDSPPAKIRSLTSSVVDTTAGAHTSANNVEKAVNVEKEAATTETDLSFAEDDSERELETLTMKTQTVTESNEAVLTSVTPSPFPPIPNSAPTTPTSVERNKPKPRIKIKLKGVTFRLPDFGDVPPETASATRKLVQVPRGCLKVATSGTSFTHTTAASAKGLNQGGFECHTESNNDPKLASFTVNMNRGKVIAPTARGSSAALSKSSLGNPKPVLKEGSVSKGSSFTGATPPLTSSPGRRLSWANSLESPPTTPLAAPSAPSLKKPPAHWFKPRHVSVPLFSPLRGSKKAFASGVPEQNLPEDAAISNKTADQEMNPAQPQPQQPVSLYQYFHLQQQAYRNQNASDAPSAPFARHH